MAVLGGVDLAKLVRMEDKELRIYIRSILSHTMPGGRYVFGSGNTIANYVPLEKIAIMLEETYNWG